MAAGTVVLQVDYDNHSLFRSKEGKQTKGSPVRIFTNLSANSLPLPSSQGYWSVGEEEKNERETETERQKQTDRQTERERERMSDLGNGRKGFQFKTSQRMNGKTGVPRKNTLVRCR